MTTEAITWKPVTDKPASDTTVLLFDPAASEPVWLGYIVDPADYGVAQHRERLFIVAARAKRPLLLLRLPQREHVPASRDRHPIVDGDRMRMFFAQECRAAMGFPADYKLPAQHRLAVHMLGNAVCPPAARDVILARKEAA